MGLGLWFFVCLVVIFVAVVVVVVVFVVVVDVVVYIFAVVVFVVLLSVCGFCGCCCCCCLVGWLFFVCFLFCFVLHNYYYVRIYRILGNTALSFKIHLHFFLAKIITICIQ